MKITYYRHYNRAIFADFITTSDKSYVSHTDDEVTISVPVYDDDEFGEREHVTFTRHFSIVRRDAINRSEQQKIAIDATLTELFASTHAINEKG